MEDRFLQPAGRLLCFQLLGFILATVILFHLAGPSESLGATDSLVLTARIDKSYVDRHHPQDRFLEIVVQAAAGRRHVQRQYRRPPLPIALLFGPPGFIQHGVRHRDVVVAGNLTVDVQLGRKFRLIEVLADDYQIHGRTVTLFGGDLLAGECRRFLIRVRGTSHRSGKYNVANVAMRYFSVGQGQRVKQQQVVSSKYKKKDRRRGYHHQASFQRRRGGDHQGARVIEKKRGRRSQQFAGKGGVAFEWRVGRR